jgi:hypothetical protein
MVVDFYSQRQLFLLICILLMAANFSSRLQWLVYSFIPIEGG